MKVALSVLDLASVGTGSRASVALRQTVELAQLAERLGYTRYWLAEHHGMPSVASSEPEVLIAHVAAATRRIRIGAGGVMLPNHAPLRIAEAFHTLHALHPGRIDLGIGRAPGTDPVTSMALRPFDAEQFPAQLAELVALSRRTFPPDHPFYSVRVMPDDVELPPIWLLGSSGATARLAGASGFGYGFASHFSPVPPRPAIDAYRESFRPSPWFERPHVILGVSVVCAETTERAEYLAGTVDLARVRLHRGELGPLPSPEEAWAYRYSEEEKAVVRQYRSLLVWGDPPTVRERLERLAAETGADELMISSLFHSHEDRMRSYELVAQAFGLPGTRGAPTTP